MCGNDGSSRQGRVLDGLTALIRHAEFDCPRPPPAPRPLSPPLDISQDVEWPRELYVDVLSCKALLPPAPGNAQQSSASSGMYAETATASVTTEGDGDRNAIEPETPAAGARSVKSVSLAEKVVAGGVTPEGCADVAVGGPETAAEGADGDRVVIDCSAGIEKPCQPDAGEMGSVVGETDEDEALSGSGSGSSGSTSSEGEEEEVVEGVGELEDGIGVDYAREGMECFVRIHNATTGRDLQVGYRGWLVVVRGSSLAGSHGHLQPDSKL